VFKRQTCICSLKQIDELAIALGDRGNCLLAYRFFAPPRDQRIPENSSTDGKADKALHLRCDSEPLISVVCASPNGDFQPNILV